MKQAGLGVRHADIQKGKGIRYPAAFVYTESGNFSKVGQVKFRCELGVFVLVAFRNVDTEKKRRHGLYPILEGVIQGLMFNDLGLEIRPLVPVRFHNITDKEFRADPGHAGGDGGGISGGSGDKGGRGAGKTREAENA